MTAVSNAQNNSARFLILAGTTAVGKTEVSIPLAKSLKGEIISADSRQIFRELEIGTAKPNAEQLAEIPHHFINEKNIRERWTAGDFGREARARIREILGRGRVPIVVGGSGLYLRALLDGFYEDSFESPSDYLKLREELHTRGVEAMYLELQKCDAELASRTELQDHHRILRGISVYRNTGTPLSELQKKSAEPIGIPFQLFFLYGDRVQTYERVNKRVIDMVNQGLVEEVKTLQAQGYDETNCNALKTHGYQEVFPYLRGEISREQMIDEIQKAVRHYVKRQLTWFRKEERTIWTERSYAESAENVAEKMRFNYELGIRN